MFFSSNSVLETKFHIPPSRAAGVTRPRLLAILQTGLNETHKFTLVSAPAGYGKTTLVTDWVHSFASDYRVAWLSLDKGDNDLPRFLGYWISAFRRMDETLGEDLRSVLAMAQIPSPTAIMDTLINELVGVQPPMIVVVEDYHLISNPVIHEALEYFIEHQPSHVHLVMTTREDPPLPLAKMRSRGQMTEIRAHQLRFTPEEACEFFNQTMRLDLEMDSVNILEERTEGWAAGLQLAAMALQNLPKQQDFIHTFHGSHRYVLDYLAEEVLRQQDEETRTFLFQTAILDKFNPSLCDAVTGRSDSQIRLAQLEQANMFIIPLDNERIWYRYHHLFADYLRIGVEKTGEALLQEKASCWYEAQNMPVEAIDHALAANDHARVVGLLETHGWELLNQGYALKMEAWMQSIPTELQNHSPRANLGFAWVHLLRGNLEMVAPYLNHAEDALKHLDASDPETLDLRAESLALQSNLLQIQGDSAGSIEAARQALNWVRPDNLRVSGLAWLGSGAAYRDQAEYERSAAALQNAIHASRVSGDLVTNMLATAHLSLMALQYGRLHFAVKTAEESLARVNQPDTVPPPIVGAIHGALGIIYYEWNQVEKAREHFERGLSPCTFSGHNASLIYTQANLARLLQAEGDLNAAAKMVGEAAGLLGHDAPDWVRTELIARQVSLLLTQGNPDTAEAVLLQSGVAADAEIWHQTDGIHLAWLRWLYYQKRPEAFELAKRIVLSAESDHRNRTLLQALILGGLIRANDPKTSQEWLSRALELAKPEGYVRIFLDEGAILAELVSNARCTDPKYVDQLLQAFSSQAQEPYQKSRHPANETLVTPLSEQELRVLSLILAGKSNQEIAHELVISLGTAKWHVHNILQKLEVNNRPQAIARAHALGL